MIASYTSLVTSCIAAFQTSESILLVDPAKLEPIELPWIVRNLWLIPVVPMIMAGLIALLKQSQRKISATLAIGGLGFSLVLSIFAFGHVVSEWKLVSWALRSWSKEGWPVREVVNFNWIELGSTHLQLGWVL